MRRKLQAQVEQAEILNGIVASHKSVKEIHNKFIKFQTGVVNIAVKGNPIAAELQALEE